MVFHALSDGIAGNVLKVIVIKDVVSCSGPFWKLISRFFFITKYNTIVLIFLFLLAL